MELPKIVSNISIYSIESDEPDEKAEICNKLEDLPELLTVV